MNILHFLHTPLAFFRRIFASKKVFLSFIFVFFFFISVDNFQVQRGEQSMGGVFEKYFFSSVFAEDDAGGGGDYGINSSISFDAVPDSLQVIANNNRGVQVFYTKPTAIYNVNGEYAGSPLVSCISPSGTVFPLGKTVVECSAGNPLTGLDEKVSFIINVLYKDTIAPVLSLIGSSEKTTTQGSLYNDSGVTAIDNIDGDITSRVEVSGAVNTSVPGTYFLTYRVSDSAENQAVSITRKVTVLPFSPTVAPTITSISVTPSIIVDSSTMSITWSGNNSPTSYKVKVDSTVVDVGTSLSWNGTPRSLNLITGPHTISVQACNSAGCSGYSSEKVFIVGTSVVSYHITATSGNGGSISPSGDISIIAGGSKTFSITPYTGYAIDSVLVDGRNRGALTGYTFSDVQSAHTITANFSPIINQNKDTTPPVIILKGANQITVAKGSTYIDQGATAFDNKDGDITSRIVVSGSVVTSVPGTYTLTYQVTDTAGNQAVPVRRIVTIQGESAGKKDTIRPIISIIGPTSITLPKGSTYVDLGATARDNKDGDITSRITVSGSVRTSVPGVYYIRYRVSDRAGNSAISVTRKVTILSSGTPDTRPPVITITGANPITVLQGSVYIDQGATALDAVDGVIAVSATGTVDTATLGSYSITYTASDSSNNQSSAVRTVNVVSSGTSDVTPPVITITGANPITVLQGSVYIDQGATALDAVDGVIAVSATGTVDTATLGSYSITYTASDSSNNQSSAVRTVNVVSSGTSDVTPPVITITGANPITVLQGSVYIDQGATALDAVDGVIAVSATGTVDTATLGSYSITYTASDSSNNQSSAVRTVNVVSSGTSDVTPPVITITGANPITVLQGSVYIDQGATALDAVDGVIAVSATGTVDTATLGSYSITYTASDSSNNQSSAVRTVNVVSSGTSDVTPPVITITGANPITVLQGSVYIDQGATALDAVDGVIAVSATGTVDTATLGSYSITYTASDSSNNQSSAVRTVNVVSSGTSDVTPPVITITGANPITVLQGSVYIDQGATALDAVDGDLTSSLVATGTVNTAATGTYEILYTVSDLSGNIASSTRVIVVTESSPVTFDIVASAGAFGTISPNGTTTVVSGASQTYTITPDAFYDVASVTIDGTSVATTTSYTFSNVSTSHTISASFVSITGTTTDTIAPVITITGSSSVTIPTGSTYVDLGATALDNVDGDVTGNIITNNFVSTTTAGEYTVVYSVSDLSGNFATATRTVTVVDASSTFFDIVASAQSHGTITPSGTSSVLVGSSLTYTITPDALYDVASVMIDGVSIATTTSYTFNSITSNHTIDVTFMAVDSGTTTDTVPPVLSMNGSSSVTVLRNGVYLELGATALDLVDGDITSRIIATSTVDTTTLGVYTVVYTVSDLAGNQASSTRVVTVIDPIVVTTDVTPPTTPVIIDATTTATSTGVSTVMSSWGDSTDETALLGYSFVWDQSADTVPDSIVETGTTTMTTLLPDGTWYLHVLAVDSSLNVSTTSTFGPITLTTVATGDITPPSGPTLVTSSTHTASATSSVQTINVAWDAATDDMSLAGYSYIWDLSASTTPDASVESTLPGTSSILPLGTWYFHVLAVDAAGNVSTTTAHFGPVVIDVASSSDVVPPTGPTLVTSATHVASSTTSAHTVQVEWDDAFDETALMGYSYSIDTSSLGATDSVVDTQSTSTSFVVGDGTWYFHVQSVDAAGNVSTSITFGPIVVAATIAGDSTPPQTPIATLTKTSSSTLFASWTDSTDNIAVAGYSVMFSTSSSVVPDSIIETSGTSSLVTVTDGAWYVFVRAVDTSLNTSSVAQSAQVIIDTHPPVLSLVGSSTLAVATDTLFVDPGALAVDSIDGDISQNIIASGTVNTASVGTYIITYTVSDSSGNNAMPVTRTVHVLASPDVDPPVITLNGSSTMTVDQGGVFTDPLATALDHVDGNVTQYISVTGNVDTSILGTYVRTYSVSDSSGNSASVTRTIQVIPLVYHTLTASSLGQGLITPSGTTTILEGASQLYTIASNHGYDFTDLLIDGVSVATTTSYMFSSVIVDHTIQAVFTAQPTRPAFTVTASSSVNGTLSVATSSVVLQGDDQPITITPDVGYYVGSVLVDGVSVATSSVYTFTNVNADHTIEVTFDAYPLDMIPPSAVTPTSSSHQVNIPSQNTSLMMSWGTSTDNGSGVQGYSFILDQLSSTDPDAIVETTSLSTTQTVSPGTWYFHVRAVDNVGNVSAATHFGPILVTDGTVLLMNTFVDGNHYASYAPTLASSTELGITGTSTIINSNLISPFTIANSTLTSVTASSSVLTNVTASDSFFYNSALTNCTVTNSYLKNYTGSDCVINNSFLDPIGQTNDVTGSTIVLSTLFASDVTYSDVTSSYIATSTVTGSTLLNSTSTFSDIASSTLHDSVVGTSQLQNVTVAPGATGVIITGSVLQGTILTGTSTSITNSTVGNTTLTNAVIDNNIILEGTVLLPDGSSLIISAPTSVASVINIAPVVQVSVSTNQGLLTLTDSSTDQNATTSLYLHDSWTYIVTYGDGTQNTRTAATLGDVFTHTYSTSGVYTVTVTLQDAYGASSAFTTQVSVTVPTVTGGGGGGSSSGGGWFVYMSPLSTSTNSTASSSTSLYVSNTGETLSVLPVGKVAGVATSTKSTTTKKIAAPKKKVVNTLTKKSPAQPVLPIVLPVVHATSDEKTFCAYIPEKVISWKDKVQGYLKVLVGK